MPEMDPEYMTNVWVKVRKDKHFNVLCGMLRGLFNANGQSAGQATKNKEFERGILVSFGTGPGARAFIGAAEALFSKRALKRVTLELRG